MTRKIIIIAIIMCNSIPIMAQRYLRNMQGIHLAGGYVPKLGYNIYGGYSIYDKWRNRWIFSADYLQKNYVYNETAALPMRQYCLNIEFYRPVAVSPNRNFFFSLGLGGLVGYETINDGKKLLSDGAVIQNNDKWIYGGTLGVECEYFYNNRTVVIFGAKERICGGSSLTLFHTSIYLGVKIMLFANEI